MEIKILISICCFINLVCGQLNQNCTSNFNCIDKININQSSICCIDGVCVSHDICIQRNRYTYLISGMVGVLITILTIIYFLLTIRNSRKNVLEIKKNLDEVNNK